MVVQPECCSQDQTDAEGEPNGGYGIGMDEPVESLAGAGGGTFVVVKGA